MFEIAPGIFAEESELIEVRDRYPLLINSSELTITFKADTDGSKCRVVLHADVDREEAIEIPVCPKMHHEVSELLEHLTKDLISHMYVGEEKSQEVNEEAWRLNKLQTEQLPPGFYL